MHFRELSCPQTTFDSVPLPNNDVEWCAGFNEKRCISVSGRPDHQNPASEAKSTTNRAYPQREKTAEGKRVCHGTCTVSTASEHRDLRLMTVTGRGECVRGIQVARTLFPHKPARLETCQSEANERLRRANLSYGWPSGICLRRPWISLDPVGTCFLWRRHRPTQRVCLDHFDIMVLRSVFLCAWRKSWKSFQCHRPPSRVCCTCWRLRSATRVLCLWRVKVLAPYSEIGRTQYELIWCWI